MTDIIPTVGRIVLYKFTKEQADAINAKRAVNQADEHIKYGGKLIKKHHFVMRGNTVSEGSVYPAIVVAVWGDTPTSALNAQVFLDGTDTYWASSISVGDEPGHYQWMPYQKAVAAGTIPATVHADPAPVATEEPAPQSAA